MAVSIGDITVDRRIFEAAQIVFSRYGYRRASMDAVAREANLSRQGLYRHFSSKDALFASVIETMHDFADAAADAAVAEARAAKRGSGEVIGAMLAARLEYYAGRILGSPHAAELMEVSTRIGGAIIAARSDAAKDALKHVIQSERAAGRLTLKRGITPGELAELLTAAANGAKHGAELLAADALRAKVARIAALMVDGARG